MILVGLPHKVLIYYRAPQCMSPRWNWDSPTPLRPTPPTKGWGGQHSPGDNAGGSSHSPRLEKRLALCLLCGLPLSLSPGEHLVWNGFIVPPILSPLWLWLQRLLMHRPHHHLFSSFFFLSFLSFFVGIILDFSSFLIVSVSLLFIILCFSLLSHFQISFFLSLKGTVAWDVFLA